MNYWQYLAGIGALLNDFIAVISVIGSAIVLFSPSRANSFVDLSLVAFLLGAVCQIAMRVTRMMPASIGFLRFSPQLVDILLAVAFVFLVLKLFMSLLRTRQSPL